MSIDRGDLDGNGLVEYFTTDMKPYTIGPQVIAAWMPLMDAAAKQREAVKAKEAPVHQE